MSNFQLEDLLRAGVHFGHLARRWCPKMKPYIFMEKNGVHIIDLQKTVVLADDALKALEAIAQTGREIMFVGTKKQAKQIIAEEAERAGMPYVCERWLGTRVRLFFSSSMVSPVTSSFRTSRSVFLCRISTSLPARMMTVEL